MSEHDEHIPGVSGRWLIWQSDKPSMVGAEPLVIIDGVMPDRWRARSSRKRWLWMRIQSAAELDRALGPDIKAVALVQR